MGDPFFSSADIEQFARDGYVIARGLADAATLEKLGRLAREHLARHAPPLEYEADLSYPGAPPSRDAAGGRTVRRLLQACARDTAFREWAASPVLASRLKQLLGPHIVLSQAHHNCIMTKDPSYSSITSWHQDIRYWAFERPELVSAWLALGHEYRENGCLFLLPGTHTMDFAPARLDEAKFLRTDLDGNQALLQTMRLAELEPGDVLFFHCRLFHAAGHNQSAATKFSLVFTYHAADNRPLPGTRSASLPELPI